MGFPDSPRLLIPPVPMSTPVLDDILTRLENHPFAPIDNGFTVAPGTKSDGVPDRESTDWRVRTLAVRDLVRLGIEDIGPVVDTLEHDRPAVRQLIAMALGLLRAEAATAPLTHRLQQDPDPVVRAHAAVALGQIGEPNKTIFRLADTADHRDVRHQCAVAQHRIETNAPVEPAVADQWAALAPSSFGRVQAGDRAPEIALEDTDGHTWRLSDQQGDKTVVLLWVFADWCPVCHKEFHDLIRREDRFRTQNIEVVTLQCHDRYRSRVMAGQEFWPSYWFADDLPGEHPLAPYPEDRWWPHLVDRAATAGLHYGIDPLQFAVHSELVNRPTTAIVAPDGTVRFAYTGRYWGDRPAIGQLLQMIERGTYTFDPPPLRRGPH